jgi:hypothetical protein
MPPCRALAADFNENVPNTRYHALTSQSLFDKATSACNKSYARCFWPRDDVPCPDACDEAVQAATVNGLDGSIDIYDIYEDGACAPPSPPRLLGRRPRAPPPPRALP